MTYPQFVESLSLLAIYAAERLRLFYPNIAGTNPCKRTRGAPKKADESSSRVHAGVGCKGRSDGDKDSQRVPGVGSSGKETRGRSADLARNKTVPTLPVVQRQGTTRCVDQAKRLNSGLGLGSARHRKFGRQIVLRLCSVLTPLRWHAVESAPCGSSLVGLWRRPTLTLLCLVESNGLAKRFQFLSDTNIEHTGKYIRVILKDHSRV